MENKENTENDEFEFNDGVGDMLRSKEPQGFGWISTVIIIVLSLIVIVLSFWISFSVGKKIFLQKEAPVYNLEEIDYSKMEEAQPLVEERKLEEYTEPKAAPEVIQPVSVPEPTPPAPKIAPPVTKPQPVIAPKTVAPAPAKSAPAVAPVVPKTVTAPPPRVEKPIVSSPVAPPAEQTTAVVATKVVYRVIAGSFAVRSEADNMVAELKTHAVDSYVLTATSAGQPIFRVQTGAFSIKGSADKQVSDLRNLGYDAFMMQ